MKIKQYQVDAFAERPFTGNPAAVCLLEQWPDDALLQAIAEENNLSETAFLVPFADGFHLRWFTPATEVPLCGHATLAAAHVVFQHLNFSGREALFHTLSGVLPVVREGGRLLMNFPVSRPEICLNPPAALSEALGRQPLEVWAADDYLVLLSDEDDIKTLIPDFAGLATLDLRGVIVTAAGRDCDFVSRFFGPKLGINEDPVTGSAHCQLAPFWADRLGREHLIGKQVSRRGGTIECQLLGERILLAGKAVTVISAEIECP